MEGDKRIRGELNQKDVRTTSWKEMIPVNDNGDQRIDRLLPNKSALKCGTDKKQTPFVLFHCNLGEVGKIAYPAINT